MVHPVHTPDMLLPAVHGGWKGMCTNAGTSLSSLPSHQRTHGQMLSQIQELGIFPCPTAGFPPLTRIETRQYHKKWLAANLLYGHFVWTLVCNYLAEINSLIGATPCELPWRVSNPMMRWWGIPAPHRFTVQSCLAAPFSLPWVKSTVIISKLPHCSAQGRKGHLLSCQLNCSLPLAWFGV